MIVRKGISKVFVSKRGNIKFSGAISVGDVIILPDKRIQL